jgi:hypothetical protein
METRMIGDYVMKDEIENTRDRLYAGDNPNEVYPGGYGYLFLEI